MPRPLRYPLVDVPQHVIQCGHNREPVLLHPADYQMYLQGCVCNGGKSGSDSN